MAENDTSITYTVKIELADIEGDVIDKIAEAVAKKIARHYPHPVPMPGWPAPYHPPYPGGYWWQTTGTSSSKSGGYRLYNTDTEENV